jgi:sulfate adenylyltransferase subunit 2
VTVNGKLPPHLAALEAEAIHIVREAAAEARNPVLLFSGGKDSTVLATIAARAFHPSRVPFPLLHIDSTWEFGETLVFRDTFAKSIGADVIVHSNEEGRRQGISPFVHGSAAYTEIMRTEPLKEILTRNGYDVIFGGARRDEEKSRAKERIFSVRGPNHSWEPRQQRPELWRLYNTRLPVNGSARVFPLSNWTEVDIWTYLMWREVEIAPLYYAAERPTVERDGTIIVVDDPDRFPFQPNEVAVPRMVRFRTVGCWPVTGAMPSEATDMASIVRETLLADTSERQGRLIDTDDGGSLETKKRAGYF